MLIAKPAFPSSSIRVVADLPFLVQPCPLHDSVLDCCLVEGFFATTDLDLIEDETPKQDLSAYMT